MSARTGNLGGPPRVGDVPAETVVSVRLLPDTTAALDAACGHRGRSKYLRDVLVRHLAEKIEGEAR